MEQVAEAIIRSSHHGCSRSPKGKESSPFQSHGGTKKQLSSDALLPRTNTTTLNHINPRGSEDQSPGPCQPRSPRQKQT
ncbi:hypothetical protein LIER_14732 [Lithospermum erythrorhizon]|uniref:Uncharacterized protein n=1 Tax=Lithospermum erythrorhizon TaxID=34254 RepID=A0AAV3Q073_LITER